LFAGTETGIDVSFDDGDQWQPLQLNLPTTAVRDVAINGNDLVAATHGRSFWVLDDISPLRQASAQIADTPLHLFTPQAAIRIHEAGTYSVPAGVRGANPPDGAVIDYSIGTPSPPATAATGDVAIEITDSTGRVAFSATSKDSQGGVDDSESGADDRGSAAPGMHRIVWNLRYPLPPLIPGTAYDERPPRGVMAVPGVYQVALTSGDRRVTAPLVIKNDPRATVTHEALVAEFTLASRLMAMLGEVHAAVREIQTALRDRAQRGDKSGTFEREAEEVLNALYEPKARTGTDLLNYPMQLNARIAYLEDEVDFGDGAPTA